MDFRLEKISGKWVYDDKFLEWLKENSFKYKSSSAIAKELNMDRSSIIKIIKDNNLNLIYKMNNNVKYKMNRENYKTRLIGQSFGLLKVLDFYGYNKYKQILYKCECQCNSKTIIYKTYTDLNSGKTDNCGCLTKSKLKNSKMKRNKYDLSGNYGIGWATNNNSEFYFDLEDYNLIKDYCWLEKYGYIKSTVYIKSKYKNKRKEIQMHRIVMNVTDYEVKVDHIYHNKNDNRKENLRLCNSQQNSFNHKIHSNNTTGYSGISYCKEKKNKKYRARIFINKKGIQLGYFKTLEEAIEVRKLAEEKYFGEYKVID